MSDANQKTLATYNDGVVAYIEGTVQETSGFQKHWLDFVVADVSKNADILEIGSAFGRDAKYLIDQGYSVDLTDASTGFVKYLNEHGFQARVLDIVENAPKKQYDVILACAVLLHLTEEDFRKALANVKSGLAKGGRFAFSLKQGEGEEWSEAKMGSPRYFKYWRKEDVEKELNLVDLEATDFQTTDDNKWLHVIARSTQD